MQKVRNYTRTARGRRYKMLQTSFAEIRRGKTSSARYTLFALQRGYSAGDGRSQITN